MCVCGALLFVGSPNVCVCVFFVNKLFNWFSKIEMQCTEKGKEERAHMNRESKLVFDTFYQKAMHTMPSRAAMTRAGISL